MSDLRSTATNDVLAERLVRLAQKDGVLAIPGLQAGLLDAACILSSKAPLSESGASCDRIGEPSCDPVGHAGSGPVSAVEFDEKFGELLKRPLPVEVTDAISNGPNPGERFNDEWKRRELFAERIARLAYAIGTAESLRSSAAENERVSYRIGYVDGATGKPPQVKLTEGEQASIGTKSAMRAICPENMQPCKEGCVDGWCQTMFGHPNG